MPEYRFAFRYTPSDVASAQRMRFLRSGRLKVLIFIWLSSSLVLATPLIFPQMFPGSPFTSWSLVVQIALIYAVTMVVLVLVTPRVEYYFQRFWRLPLLLRLSDKMLRLSVDGSKSPGLRLPWEQIRRVDENERVFVVYYGEGNKFIILPKSTFKDHGGAEERFRKLLSKAGAAPAQPAQPDEPESEEEETQA